MNPAIKKKVLRAQQFEITEYWIYKKLATQASGKNRKTLEQLAEGELAHYNLWKELTGKEVPPKAFQIFFYYFVARLLGLNFGLRLLEKNEQASHNFYEELQAHEPAAKALIKEEEVLEARLINLIDTEELKYMGSVILGLNDALVELLGTLAGLTFAFKNTHVVALASLITGIAATMSMAASEYLSTKEEGNKSPFKASAYTGMAYFMVVFLLILPYLVLQLPFFALALSFSTALIIVGLFTLYVSVAKDLDFKKKFLEIAAVTFGVAILSFLIGSLARQFLPLD